MQTPVHVGDGDSNGDGDGDGDGVVGVVGVGVACSSVNFLVQSSVAPVPLVTVSRTVFWP